MSHYLTQSLHRARRLQPDAAATVFGERGQSWHALTDRVARFATVLAERGAGPGDRVAILALNSDRMVECLLACFWAGTVACPLNTRWTPAEIVQALGHCDADLLIVDDAFAATVPTLREHLALTTIIHIGDAPTPAGLHSYEALVAVASPADDRLRSGDDLAMLIHTGGTTGRPKGVMLSHGNLATAALGMSAMGMGTQGSFLLTVPLFHMAGIQMLFNHLLGGEPMWILPAFDPVATLAKLAHGEIGSLMLVPTMLQMLIDHPAAANHDLCGLRRIYYGASPISEALLEKALARFPTTEFVQGYGMTKTGITLMLPHRYHSAEGRRLGKLRSAGLTTPTAEIRIVDADDRELPRGQPGEILARGPAIMQGYWQQPALSAEALRDGWMHTGDIGTMDDDGFVFIVDRLKDMIVSGGENVYSAEVENALARHPAVAQCAVIGVPDARWGERVHAVIVRREGSDADESALGAAMISHCRQLIASYKCPRSIEFRAALPISAAGKLLKNELRAPYWQGQERGVA